MAAFEIYVQQGCVPDSLRPSLESAIRSACRTVLGPVSLPVNVAWTVIARGCGFRGGVPSTTSLVRGRIPDGCDRETRARFLRTIGREWCDQVGCAPDEVLVSARDWSWTG